MSTTMGDWVELQLNSGRTVTGQVWSLHSRPGWVWVALESGEYVEVPRSSCAHVSRHVQPALSY